MTAMTFTGSTTTPNADADVWGVKNDADKDNIAVDLGVLNTCAANRIKGNNTGSSANVIDLTAAQATAMLNTANPAGLKGLVPAPESGKATAVLTGAVTWDARPRVLAWGVYDSTGTIIASFNVASVVTGSGVATITFTTAMANANYLVLLTGQSSSASSPYVSHTTPPTTTTLTVNVTPNRTHFQVLAA